MGNETSQPSASGTPTSDLLSNESTDSQSQPPTSQPQPPPQRRVSTASIPRLSPVEPPEVDLSHLTNEERAQISSVVARAKELHEQGEERVGELQEDLSSYTENVSRRTSFLSLDRTGKNLCPICHVAELQATPDGKTIIGQICAECEQFVCAQCGGVTSSIDNKRSEWVCNICLKRRHLVTSTGIWYHGGEKIIPDIKMDPSLQDYEEQQEKETPQQSEKMEQEKDLPTSSDDDFHQIAEGEEEEEEGEQEEEQPPEPASIPEFYDHSPREVYPIPEEDEEVSPPGDTDPASSLIRWRGVGQNFHSDSDDEVIPEEDEDGYSDEDREKPPDPAPRDSQRIGHNKVAGSLIGDKKSNHLVEIKPSSFTEIKIGGLMEIKPAIKPPAVTEKRFSEQTLNKDESSGLSRPRSLTLIGEETTEKEDAQHSHKESMDLSTSGPSVDDKREKRGTAGGAHGPHFTRVNSCEVKNVSSSPLKATSPAGSLTRRSILESSTSSEKEDNGAKKVKDAATKRIAAKGMTTSPRDTTACTDISPPSRPLSREELYGESAADGKGSIKGALSEGDTKLILTPRPSPISPDELDGSHMMRTVTGATAFLDKPGGSQVFGSSSNAPQNIPPGAEAIGRFIVIGLKEPPKASSAMQEHSSTHIKAHETSPSSKAESPVPDFISSSAAVAISSLLASSIQFKDSQTTSATSPSLEIIGDEEVLSSPKLQKKPKPKPEPQDWSPVMDLSPIIDVSPSVEAAEQEEVAKVANEIKEMAKHPPKPPPKPTQRRFSLDEETISRPSVSEMVKMFEVKQVGENRPPLRETRSLDRGDKFFTDIHKTLVQTSPTVTTGTMTAKTPAKKIVRRLPQPTPEQIQAPPVKPKAKTIVGAPVPRIQKRVSKETKSSESPPISSPITIPSLSEKKDSKTVLQSNEAVIKQESKRVILPTAELKIEESSPYRVLESPIMPIQRSKLRSYSDAKPLSPSSSPDEYAIKTTDANGKGISPPLPHSPSVPEKDLRTSFTPISTISSHSYDKIGEYSGSQNESEMQKRNKIRRGLPPIPPQEPAQTRKLTLAEMQKVAPERSHSMNDDLRKKLQQQKAGEHARSKTSDISRHTDVRGTTDRSKSRGAAAHLEEQTREVKSGGVTAVNGNGRSRILKSGSSLDKTDFGSKTKSHKSDYPTPVLRKHKSTPVAATRTKIQRTPSTEEAAKKEDKNKKSLDRESLSHDDRLSYTKKSLLTNETEDVRRHRSRRMRGDEKFKDEDEERIHHNIDLEKKLLEQDIYGNKLPPFMMSLKQQLKEELKTATTLRRKKIEKIEAEEKAIAKQEKLLVEKSKAMRSEAMTLAMKQFHEEKQQRYDIHRKLTPPTTPAVTPTRTKTPVPSRLSPQASPRRSRHKRQGSDPKISKFSPIKEDKDIESELQAATIKVPTSSPIDDALRMHAKLDVQSIGEKIKREMEHHSDFTALSASLAEASDAFKIDQRLKRSDSLGLSLKDSIISHFDDDDDIKFSPVLSYREYPFSDPETMDYFHSHSTGRDRRYKDNYRRFEYLRSGSQEGISSLAHHHHHRSSRKSRSWHPSPYVSDDEEDHLSREEKKQKIKAEIQRRKRQLEENARLQEELFRLAEAAETSRIELAKRKYAQQCAHSTCRSSLRSAIRDSRSPSLSPTHIRDPYSMGYYGSLDEGPHYSERYTKHEYKQYKDYVDKMNYVQQPRSHDYYYSPAYTDPVLMRSMTYDYGTPYYGIEETSPNMLSPSRTYSSFPSSRDSSLSRLAHSYSHDTDYATTMEGYSDFSGTDVDTSPPSDTTPAMPLLPDLPTKSRKLLEDLGSSPITESIYDSTGNMLYRVDSDNSSHSDEPFMERLSEGGVTILKQTQRKTHPPPRTTHKYSFPIKRILLTRDPKDRYISAVSCVAGNGLGMKVVGGKIIPGTEGELGAYVAKIYPGGVVETLGEVKEGDQVLEWNGINLTGKTCEEVQKIVTASNGEIEMVIRCDINMSDRSHSSRQRSEGHSRTSSYDNLTDSKLSDYDDYDCYPQSQHGVDPDQLAAQLESIKSQRILISTSSTPKDTACLSTPSLSQSSSAPDSLSASPHIDRRRRGLKKKARLRQAGITGELQLQVDYEEKRNTLHVNVLQAHNLAPRDHQGLCDPYVKVCLMPVKSRSDKRKTKYVPRSLNPEWNQMLSFPKVDRQDLNNKWLEISVWDYDKFKSKDFLGEIIVKLADESLFEKKPRWYPLLEHAETFSFDHGRQISGGGTAPAKQLPAEQMVETFSHSPSHKKQVISNTSQSLIDHVSEKCLQNDSSLNFLSSTSAPQQISEVKSTGNSQQINGENTSLRSKFINSALAVQSYEQTNSLHTPGIQSNSVKPVTLEQFADVVDEIFPRCPSRNKDNISQMSQYNGEHTPEDGIPSHKSSNEATPQKNTEPATLSRNSSLKARNGSSSRPNSEQGDGTYSRSPVEFLSGENLSFHITEQGADMSSLRPVNRSRSRSQSGVNNKSTLSQSPSHRSRSRNHSIDQETDKFKSPSHSVRSSLAQEYGQEINNSQCHMQQNSTMQNASPSTSPHHLKYTSTDSFKEELESEQNGNIVITYKSATANLNNVSLKTHISSLSTTDGLSTVDTDLFPISPKRYSTLENDNTNSYLINSEQMSESLSRSNSRKSITSSETIAADAVSSTKLNAQESVDSINGENAEADINDESMTSKGGGLKEFLSNEEITMSNSDDHKAFQELNRRRSLGSEMPAGGIVARVVNTLSSLVR